MMAALAACKPAPSASPQDPKPETVALSGEAEAIDGDSLRVDGIEVRLEGVDAFEYDQRCGAFACGEAASRQLKRLVAGAEVVCEPQSEDRYGRILAFCAVEGRDLGEAQVRAGLALAYRRYSDRYVAAEETAKRARTGAWAYEVRAPEDFRHSR